MCPHATSPDKGRPRCFEIFMGLSYGAKPAHFTARRLGRFCYLSIFRNRILHITVDKTKIRSSGKRHWNFKAFSAISLYPHVAGNNFPIVSNTSGSSSIGNIIPESMIDGKKTIIENIEVFAGSFTARPIMLAILSDTAIKTARLMKYTLGLFGISA